MNRNFVITIAAVLLAACEGEPPKAPATPTGVNAPPPEPVEPEPTHEAPAPCAPQPQAACPCASDGGAAEADAGAPAVAEAPPVRGNVRGTVTTTPANVAQLAVVWVDDVPKDATPKPASVVIDNNKMTFGPFVQVVPAGGKVVFNNSDPFPHNVFSPDNEKFNMGSIAQKSAHVRVFEKAGTYTLLCNLHPGMIGYLVVTPSNAFAKADAKGRFTLKDLPAGTYKLTAWAPRQQPVTQSVVVKEGDTDVAFELHR